MSELKNPLVSIILPVYNGKNTIIETINSLLQQTFRDFELIVCFDGCNDDSENVVMESFNDNRIRLLKNEVNMGLGRTLNKLIAYSNPSAQYIAMAEQDDLYYPHRLERQVEILNQNPTVGLISGIADFFDGKKVTGQFPGILVNGQQYPQGKEMFLLNYIDQVKVVNSCMMLRKSVHVDNGLYFTMHLPSISVDWTYVLRFCLVSNIFGLHESLVKLRRGVSNNSLTTNKKMVYSSSRELIRSMKYEFPQIINKQDFLRSQTTQDVFELKGVSKKYIPIKFLKAWIKNPSDKRWFELIKYFIK